MADQSDRTRRATAPLVVRALRNPFYVAVHPEQALSVPERNQGAAVDRIARRLAFTALPIAIDADTPPADVFHDLHEVDRFAQMQRFHAAFDLLPLELRRFVHRHSP